MELPLQTLVQMEFDHPEMQHVVSGMSRMLSSTV